jgi:2-dehydro-3-deoxyglucarate aldolase/4-hydroxy-2-oxoheptanedioate aldolase
VGENVFKRWLQGEGPKPPLGTWLMSGAASTAEALGFAGMDFLVVDMEHVPIDVPDTLEILRAIAGTPAQAVVRLPWNDQVMVKRVLDIGATTLMFPFVQTPEEAQAAVSRTRYPPEGVRGVAAMHRASRYGTTPGYLQAANDGLAVIVQIETLEALERLPEIAAVPGVDALFLGPGDLSADMGRLGDIAHTEVQRMIARAAELARGAGKPIGIVGPNPDMVRRFLAYGYSYVAVGSDLSMMTGRAGEWMSALRGEAAQQPQASGPY